MRLRALAPLALALAAAALPGAHGIAQAEPGAAGSTTELDRLVARAESEERSLTAEIAQDRAKLDVTRRRMLARGRAYYRLVRAGLLPAGAGFDALVDHAARVERTRLSLERDIAAEAALVKRLAEIDARLARLRAERAPLDLQREALTRARQALAEGEDRRAAFARAFERSVRPDAVAIYGVDVGPSDADARAGFRSLKGRLPFPIAGRAEVRRVNRPGAGGPGIELVASAGAAVRSVAAGRVVFADRYDDYGLTVILDHGDHYYSIYANLGAVDVHVGDSVPAGSRIGGVGRDATGASVLYFELRHKAATIDPGPWLGL
jgi:septal ring factor EnvC (AmiA/AmiB activator)